MPSFSPVVAAAGIAGIAAVVVLTGAASAVGVWLGKRLTRRPGEPQVSLREKLRRDRAQLRQELTPGERRFFYAYMLLSAPLAPVAVGLVVFGSGATRAVGIGLLLAALVVMAVPISPFLRARVRRRQQDASERN
jgi:hypothetical protein